MRLQFLMLLLVLVLVSASIGAGTNSSGYYYNPQNYSGNAGGSQIDEVFYRNPNTDNSNGFIPINENNGLNTGYGAELLPSASDVVQYRSPDYYRYFSGQYLNPYYGQYGSQQYVYPQHVYSQYGSAQKLYFPYTNRQYGQSQNSHFKYSSLKLPNQYYFYGQSGSQLYGSPQYSYPQYVYPQYGFSQYGSHQLSQFPYNYGQYGQLQYGSALYPSHYKQSFFSSGADVSTHGIPYGVGQYDVASDTQVDNCEVPVSNDPHLLIDNVTESDGTKRLIFGCRPIGQYVVNNPPTDVTCKRGSWEGRYPTCRPLLEPKAIEALSKVLMKVHPCRTDAETYLDPRDRSRYISCSKGKASLNSCPKNRHFNLEVGTCEMQLYDNLKEGRSELIQVLEDLIPPISFEPHHLDDHTGILGTGPAGQLIVTPWSNFTLHCWYPENVWGYPAWNVTYSKPETVTRILKSETGKNKVSLTVTGAKEEDTGLYSCSTPFGKSHGINVSVKAVRCPLSTFRGFLANAYLPNRYMGAVAEFPCTQGKEFTMCMATGKWSKDRPECTLRKTCKFPGNPSDENLFITRHRWRRDILFFHCARGFRLVGKDSMECLANGTWSPPSFPKCVNE